MKLISYSLTFLLIYLFPPLVAWGQAQETYAEEQRLLQVRRKEAMLFKPESPSVAIQETFDILGFGVPSFSISNQANGTEESYLHQLRVSYPLLISGGKSNVQIIFYGNGDKVPYSVVKEDAGAIVYFPLQVHDQLRTRVEQAISARRKVQLKINIKPSGFREAVWLIN
jgi:hypothetical protein